MSAARRPRKAGKAPGEAPGEPTVEPPDDSAVAFAHLSPAAARALTLAAKDKIVYIKEIKKRWIGYPAATEALARVEAVYEQPRVYRMDCLLLIAHTSNGKTHVLRRFQETHPSVDDPEAPAASHPIVYVQAPDKPRDADFYDGILRAVKAPLRTREPAADKKDRVLTVLGEVGTRVLLLDEVHNLLAGPTAAQRQFRATLRYLANELCIGIVAAGIEDARTVFRFDEQLDNRFRKFTLPRWTHSAGPSGVPFLRLLASFERMLPFRQPSYLAERHALTVHNASGGLIGGVAQVLIEAGVIAVRRGAERIDAAILDDARDAIRDDAGAGPASGDVPPPA